MARDLQSDEALRQYLLGQLSDSERETVERRFVADADYFDQLLTVEDDLFDEFCRRELNQEERALFKQRLLVTPKQQQKLERTRYFQQAMTARRRPAAEPIATQARPTHSWFNIFQASRIPLWAGALGLLLLLVLGIWFVRREAQKGEDQRAQLPQNQEAQPPNNSNGPAAPTPSPATSPKIVLALNDGGGQVSVDESGNISGLNELSPATNKAVKEALTTQRLHIAPALDGVRSKSGTLMGRPAEGAAFVLEDPVGQVVRSNQPTLSWQALPSATSYTVSIYDADFREVIKSGPLNNLKWTVSSPLARGQIYLWQVTAIKNGEETKSPVPPAPEARFRVLSQDKHAALTEIEKSHRNSHLVLGVAYAEAGLLKDAQREFRLLLEANPDSTLVQNLLHQVSK